MVSEGLRPTQRALAYLASFADVERGDRPLGGLSLDRTREILAALGDPQNRYSSVIIAGTNGKGSTAVMVERALRGAGLKTGLYTQPHLHTIRERVRIDGQPISPKAFDEAMEPIRQALARLCDASRPTTAYEVMTTLALNHFAAAGVHVAVLEVGLGGRLDSTNVVEAIVSAITPISLDHTQILGDTIAAIAAEKADVIKPGRVCVTARQHPDAFAVIRRVAEERGSPLWVAEEDGAHWDVSPHEWDLITNAGRLENIRPGLRGGYQRTNIAVAASILDALRSAGIGPLALEAVRVGIEQASWPGRFEVVGASPPIVIDGAHNPAAVNALWQALDETYPGVRRVYVLGIAADKDVGGVVRALLGNDEVISPESGGGGQAPALRPAPASNRGNAVPNSAAGTPAPTVVATRANHPRAVEPEVIARVATGLGARAMTAPTVAAALELAREQAAAGDIIVVAGSLYVMAEAREGLGLAEASEQVTFDPWASR